MPKVNTLMSYFSPKPKVSNINTESTSGSTFATAQTKNNNHNVPDNVNCRKEIQQKFAPGDIVWGRVSGYPWWPAVVTHDPTSNKFSRKKKTLEIHVNFFDHPPSRAWISEMFIEVYTGGKGSDIDVGGKYFSSDKNRHIAISEANETLNLKADERLRVINQTISKETPIKNESDDESLMNISDESLKENCEIDTSARHPRAKRRKIRMRIVSEEDSGEEFKPESSSSENDSESASSGVDENEVSDGSASEPDVSPIKDNRKRKKQENNKSAGSSSPTKIRSLPSTPKHLSSFTPQSKIFSSQLSLSTKLKLSEFSSPSSGKDSREPSLKHMEYDFLKPENLRDKDKRNTADLGYDPRTLYVPDSFLKSQTPAMRQWWEIKRNRFDTILFFKMGKFYELFHMDATVAVSELGIVYMKGDYAHAGFPEISYGRYSDTLIERGYKVARIEQTETPEMMEKRVKSMFKPSKFDKVVKREVCAVTSKATKTFSFIEGSNCDYHHNYLLAVAEKQSKGNIVYGVCFLDTSIAEFQLGQFTDDRHCSRLRTLLAHYPPARVLFEKGHQSKDTQLLFKHHLASVSKEALNSRTEFWDSSKTLKCLAEGSYFTDNPEGTLEWPECFKMLVSPGDSLGLTADGEYDLAVKSLGALIWYLQNSLLDQELISLKKFSIYTPTDSPAINTNPDSSSTLNHNMVIDGVAINNLEILTNSCGLREGTLLQRLDHCTTAFGKRLLHQWLCSPLCNINAINQRLDAVEDLMTLQDTVTSVTGIMSKLPDLERLLTKIHTLGSSVRSKTHPDSRAILFEEVRYSKRKIEDLLSTLSGFSSCMEIPELFLPHRDKLKSQLLIDLVTITSDESPSARFKDLTKLLQFFDEAFDRVSAKRNGVILPNKGVNEDYDEAVGEISKVERELDVYLEQQKKILLSKNITYWGSGRNRYQMEVPESSWKYVPDEYEVMSSKKGWKRYRTPEIDRLLVALGECETKKASALQDTMRTIFHIFDESYVEWDGVVQCVAILDVLISLSTYSRSACVMCRPEFVSPNSQPFIEIRGGRHPCISDTLTGFIPNDTLIAASDSEHGSKTCDRCITIITGPNMGGKSTLMRQVGLIVLLAQLGCYVPAETLSLTPVDRIFTRLGASDRIMAGESTFFVELSETSAILQHATRHSLVLLDELGRGTATYDGTAIACAVVHDLSRRIQCRTLFSTHYHTLVNEFAHDPSIHLGHMSCMVDYENDTDPSSETITFLYKFADGPCPKSYGFNAAKLATLPDEIINCARKKAHNFEDTAMQKHMFQQLMASDDVSVIKSVKNVV